MYRWSRPVSWSRIKAAMECPKKLEFMIDRVPQREMPNYYQNMGHVVQKVFELYFNKEYNLHPKGLRVEVVKRIAQKVLASDWFKDLNTSFKTSNFLEMQSSVMQQVSNGYFYINDLGLGKEIVRSEVDVYRVVRGLELVGRLDFVHEIDHENVAVYDGKGNKHRDADPNQIKFYALLLAGSRHVNRGAFIYWRNGIEYINVTPDALHEFLNTVLPDVLHLFRQLKHGVMSLDALPEPIKCVRCPWNNKCPEAK